MATLHVGLLLLASSHGFHLGAFSRVSRESNKAAGHPLLRSTGFECREKYVPSWAQGGAAASNSTATNVYGEQQSEYAAYEAMLKEREESTRDGAAAVVSATDEASRPHPIPPVSSL